MTWVISLLVAGALFSNSGIPTVQIGSEQRSETFSQTDVTERFEQTYPFSPNGKIRVTNVNGSIAVDTWDNPQIKLEVIKISDSKERLSEMKIIIEASQDNFRVAADYGSGNDKRNIKWDKNSKLISNFILTVPKTAILDDIQTINGSVSIKNATNFTKASAINGTVKALNLRGHVELSTVNGTVEADFEEITPGNLISLSTVNGRANLMIPSDANATIRAESLNGEISNDFGLPVRKGEFIGRDLYGRIGTGEVKIKLESVNGALTVKRKNDGKSLNPSTNLLPGKSNTDENRNVDFDDDFDAAVRETQRELRDARREIEAARKQMENSVRDSRIDAVEAAKVNAVIAESIANIEIPALAPEIAKISQEALKQAVAAIDIAKLASIPKVAKAKDVKAVLADQRFPWRVPFMEEKTGTFQVKGTPTITVETSNCAVSVHGWDKPEVMYSMAKVAPNMAQKSIEFDSVQTGSGDVQLKVLNPVESGTYGTTTRDGFHVRLEIFVPKKSNLKIVTNSEVRLEGVSGNIDLKGADEAINIRDSNGKLKIKAEDGIVRVIGFRGELDANLGDGQMFLEGDFQKFQAMTGDGMVVLTIPQDTNATIVSNSDAVEAEGFQMTREISTGIPKNRWLLGKGGREFVFTTGDGALLIRNQKDLSVLF